MLMAEHEWIESRTRLDSGAAGGKPSTCLMTDKGEYRVSIAFVCGGPMPIFSSELPGIVIVGAGQAGCELAFQLARQNSGESIVLIGDEPWLPYRRPPLSKAFLAGEAAAASLYIRPAEAYKKAGIQCLIGTSVDSIDRATKHVVLGDGRRIEYRMLALTTGGRARELQLEGTASANVHYLRNISDVEALRPGFKAGRKLVVVGGGYVGLEVAAVAVSMGLDVTVVESQPRVLARVTAPEMSAYYEDFHRARGVKIRTGVGVAGLEGTGMVERVVLTDGDRLQADLVLVGIGLMPNTELAARAGLQVEDGVVVDRRCTTSDPNVVAAGDCTHHENGFLGHRLRLESVPNASEQARVAAATLLGRVLEHRAVPWFWSDQYELKLQMVGLSRGYDSLALRGSMSSNAFSMFYLRDGRIVAADAVGRPRDFLIAKRLVAQRIQTEKTRLADESVPLESLLS
jgi:3-phenylpropionate/trans-cinnamate dioxygenase ferredoxin reductase component